MAEAYDKQKQFTLTQQEFFDKLDFFNWYRYFAIIKTLSTLKPKTVLEVGPGEGAIKRLFEPYAERYAIIDVNPRLTPDFVGDVRTRFKEAEHNFDAVIAADILEHIPFKDLPTAFDNLKNYLRPGGHALITIPHRAWFFFWLAWVTYTQHLWRAPQWVRDFYQRARGNRHNPIDLDHQWEIGDGYFTTEDVERVMKNAGFEVIKREALLYVDYWVLKNPN